jgi:hypothetical protein
LSSVNSFSDLILELAAAGCDANHLIKIINNDIEDIDVLLLSKTPSLEHYFADAVLFVNFDPNGYEKYEQHQQVLNKIRTLQRLMSNRSDTKDLLAVELVNQAVLKGYALTMEIVDYLNKIQVKIK